MRSWLSYKDMHDQSNQTIFSILPTANGHCHLCSVVPRGGEGTELRKRREGTAEKGSRKIRHADKDATLDDLQAKLRS